MSTAETKRFGPDALFTPSNLMTGARLVTAPEFGYLTATFPESSWVPFGAHLTAVASDIKDGIDAREDGVTNLGTWLEPIADKAWVLAGLIGLAGRNQIPKAPVVILGARHGLLAAYRRRLKAENIPAGSIKSGKIGGIVGYIALGLMLAPPLAKNRLMNKAAAWTTATTAVFSGVHFVYVKEKQKRETHDI